MKILYVLEQGIGNVMQAIPPYLCLKDKHRVDVVYFKQFPTDGVFKTDCFPCDDIRQVNVSQLAELGKKYAVVVKPPYVYKNGEVINRLEEMIESQSEVMRNLILCDHFKIDRQVKKDIRIKDSKLRGDIVMHNGAVKGWERKRYPFFKELISELKGRYRITSIGSPDEYIEGTQDGTGTDLQHTAGTIKNHKLYLGTDTGTYHVAATMDKPGIALFTATSDTKNWDSQFHSTIDIIKTDYPCQPCQWGFHFSPEWKRCQQHRCQQIPVPWVMEAIVLKLGGVL